MPLLPNQTTNAGATTTLPPFWNPGETLQIIDKKRTKNLTHYVICVGRAARKHGARCACAIEEQSPEHAAAAVAILDDMATTPPTEVADEQLEALARQCLCSYHTHQLASATEELTQRLQPEVRYHQARTFTGMLLMFISMGYLNVNLSLPNLALLRSMKVSLIGQTHSQTGGGQQRPEAAEATRTTPPNYAGSSRNP